jgi:hypothetical protein
MQLKVSTVSIPTPVLPRRLTAEDVRSAPLLVRHTRSRRIYLAYFSRNRDDVVTTVALTELEGGRHADAFLLQDPSVYEILPAGESITITLSNA